MPSGTPASCRSSTATTSRSRSGSWLRWPKVVPGQSSSRIAARTPAGSSPRWLRRPPGRQPSNILLGAGSIRDPYAADWFIASGARFIVGPTFDPDVAALCNLRRVPYLPGCATPTEIVTAEKSGVEFVKVFPGDILGPAFVRAIRGPLPEAQVVVTGGVAATEASVREWISAGAAALGFGSGLVSKAFTSGADPAPLTRTVADLIRWVALARLRSGHLDAPARQLSRPSHPRSHSHEHRHHRSASYENLIDGRWVGAQDGATFERRSPAHDLVVGRYPQGGIAGRRRCRGGRAPRVRRGPVAADGGCGACAHPHPRRGRHSRRRGRPRVCRGARERQADHPGEG